MAGSVHGGHRERLKERFLKSGLDDFEPHNVLELLLFYTIPQKDVNELAHELINRFGSLAGVLDADIRDLTEVPGIGMHTATFLKVIPEVCRFYMVDRSDKPAVVTTIEEIADLITARFIGRNDEYVYLLCLNSEGSVAHEEFISVGTVNSAPLNPRKVTETALRARATSVVLAHNHPHGLALPSRADITATLAVSETLQKLDIKLEDHLIFGERGDFISMRSSGFLEKKF